MIIVDSNIFIYGEVADMPENKLARDRLQLLLQHDRIGVNVIIASEVFHKLQRFFGGVEASARVSNIVSSPRTDFLQFWPETVVRATKLARDFQMRINDALIAQQAMETGAAVLTDNVKDFKKVRSIKIIPLRNP